ncbi:MAG: hypothetical protein EHM89_00075 [Acidobacteria bacterium]|nr:MAG: hypothetical protein EHM89_00075 [Acidobacteriota bacterium]
MKAAKALKQMRFDNLEAAKRNKELLLSVVAERQRVVEIAQAIGTDYRNAMNDLHVAVGVWREHAPGVRPDDLAMIERKLGLVATEVVHAE